MPYRIEDKIKFLSEASKILSSSLDYKATIAVVANLVVNNLSDFCLVDVIEGENMKRLAVGVSDGKHEGIVQKFFGFTPDPENKKAIYEAAKLGKPIIIRKATKQWLSTVSKIPEEKEIVSKLNLKSFIFAPLKSRGKIVGVMTLASNKDKFYYKQGDSIFIEELAGRIGLAIDNARLFSQTQEALKVRNAQSAMLRSIYKSALDFLAPQSLPQTYKIAVSEAIKIAQAEFGIIFLENNGILSRVYTNMKDPGYVEPRRDGYTYRSFKTGRTQLLTSDKKDRINPKLTALGIKSIVIIPLTYHNKAIGALTLLAKNDKHFTRDKLELLRVFCGLVSLAIEKTRLYKEAESTLKTRDLFISMAAHELRTPTTTIQGYTQMMKRKSEKGEPVPQKWVSILYGETVRLNNLLRELLRVEQVKTGQLKYTWKRNSLTEIIERVIGASSVTHPNHKVIFENKIRKGSDVILCDFDKIMQAVINLVNNAAKFSPSGTRIKISLFHRGSNIIIAVKDEGSGISKKDLPHVVEGFYKGEEHTKEGMGLGLFLTENIVQRHGGSINVKSQLGKGTVVEMIFPTNPSHII